VLGTLIKKCYRLITSPFHKTPSQNVPPRSSSPYPFKSLTPVPDQDQPQSPTPEVKTNPLEEARKQALENYKKLATSPKFIEFSRNIWMRAGLGFYPYEAAFYIFDNDEYALVPFTNEHGKINFILDLDRAQKLKAVVHTHPNTSLPCPSPADKKTAQKFFCDVFVLSLSGLQVFSPEHGTTFVVFDDLSWMNTKKG